MAILVEEERRPMNWIGILSVVVVLLGVVLGGYYLFFKAPETIDVVVPGNLENIRAISQLNFDPRTVLDPSSGDRAGKVFQILHDYTTPLVSPAPGKNDPFRPL